MRIFVRVLRAHSLEPIDVQVGQVSAVFASWLLQSRVVHHVDIK